LNKTSVLEIKFGIRKLSDEDKKRRVKDEKIVKKITGIIKPESKRIKSNVKKEVYFKKEVIKEENVKKETFIGENIKKEFGFLKEV